MVQQVFITGATGLIGRALCKALIDHGHRVTAMTRNVASAKKCLPEVVQVVDWHKDKWADLPDYISKADAIVHLAATSVGERRWTHSFKQKILGSRVSTTRALVDAMQAAAIKPRLFLSMSGIGYYGDRGEELVYESTPAGADFLASVCVAWEAEALKAAALTRVVIPRTAVVLSSDGGALPRLAVPFRFFIGGPIGNGRQYFPWIHLDDVVSFCVRAVEHELFSGVYNLCAPQSVKNLEFCAALARHLRRPCWLPVPSPLLRLAVGEFADTLLGGQRAVPARLVDDGFSFSYPTLPEALAALQ
jgi:uncharacterized protein